jgi:hypothetical protein
VPLCPCAPPPCPQLAVDSDVLSTVTRTHAVERAAYLLFGPGNNTNATAVPVIGAFTVVASTTAWTNVSLPSGFRNPVVTCSPVYEFCEACAR